MPEHPYIPNSVQNIKKEMLDEIGVKSVEELFASVPQEIRIKKKLEIPHTTSEYEVRKKIEELLSKNVTSKEMLTFLGGGCWPHYIPAVCDEINSRSEFVTAYAGDAYSDLGRYQALFEFQSMIADLVSMDVVSFPTYDWGSASGDAIRMAILSTGRNEILVPQTISPERLSVIRSYCEQLANIRVVDYSPETGQLNLEDLKSKISSKTAGIYIENPTYLGFIETEGEEISEIAHNHGALFIAGVEPLSLGILTPPGEYGADIVCGEGQPLGMHMYLGGGLLGFIACHDDEQILSSSGHRFVSITKTERKGEWGFTYVLPERSMLNAREKATTITGTATVLWAITAAAYMSLLGPQGMQELAKVIMQKSNYAIKGISELKGVKTPIFNSPHFKEFIVNFEGTGKTTLEVNKALLKCGIQGGKDITKEFPELGKSALYCVTEVHSKKDIDRLVNTLEEIIG
ncbi:MAG: aminomethyl-transferring glycine dehydrogenase subunit GcvPA [Candidatus Bathyarchaeota archaeon]|nr:aminomethyl-transferring glycine dehydrogenase subunit GcvPA [Candidatus Bathyarchaeota archaeon]